MQACAVLPFWARGNGTGSKSLSVCRLLSYWRPLSDVDSDFSWSEVDVRCVFKLVGAVLCFFLGGSGRPSMGALFLPITIPFLK